MKLPGSNFVGLFGIGLLAVLILISAYLGYTVLESFLIIILLLCLTAYLWARFSLRKIRVKMALNECTAFPGQKMEAEASLSNEKFLPLLWLDLQFPTEGKTCVAPLTEEDEDEDGVAKSEKKICESFSWIMPHQKLSWRQEALAVHRGVCRVDHLCLFSGDGFGLTTQEKKAELPGGFRFVVYPEIIPVDAGPVLNNMSELEPVKNGFYTDKTLLSSTRDYREGDSFRDINWRLMARQDSLQVNVHEQLSMRRVCFVPDVESFCYRTEVDDGRERRTVTCVRKEEMERMFSLIASLIVKLHEREVLCTLVIPEIGGSASRMLIPEVREMQIMEHLSALAEVEYNAEPTRLPLDDMINERHKLGQFYILSYKLSTSCCGAESEELAAFRIVQELPEEGILDGHIIRETDLTLV